MEPATPLGAAIGLDVGVDVTVVSLPQDFKNAISTASGVTFHDSGLHSASEPERSQRASP